MKNYYADVMQFRGDHASFGYKQGQWLLQSYLNPIYTNSDSMKKVRFSFDQKEAVQWTKSLFPHFYEELDGLAEGLKMSLEQVLLHFSGFQQEWRRSGCSIITGDHFLVRNYDFHPKTYEGRFVLYQPDHGYATIGPSQRIVGRADGLNEKGLTTGYNFVNRRNTGDGFIPTIITRMMLETCQSNEEAIALLKEVPHRVAFNYVLADRFGNRHVVEATSDAVRVKEDTVSTNHFDILTESNRYHLADSKRRMAIFREQPPSLTKRDAFQLLNNIEHEVFSEKYPQSGGTLHTTVYDLHSLEAGIALGHNRVPTTFSFRDWLKGQDSWIRKVRGQINTKERMPYMEGLE
ncbi:C45 family autoproteolytic acyltransferase/hydolase [Gracilibacillus salinarum]|uniref:C45 family autoproteolytic acyltransferase/hydrolase n=1 Tax=Gracilibacillus salinarum TaxID=2932255 RepID=A0ABY4GR50_9BACI|nr:C45 family peptidase [Gracilibacillus salinarum]UOQ86873.1 C45 family autoproteolytic acyltransferase/hydrolase [Gracilibacillus salinarum]